MLRVIETFSGIGSQVQALKNIGVDYSVEAIVEWEIGAMYAYDIIHNGPQYLLDYRHHTRDSLVTQISGYNLSNDGKQPLTDRALNSMSMRQLKAIMGAIERNNNLVDISSVHSEDLPDCDVLTYSFPCQDLSVSGHWHHNVGGINRNANNRSTLLWQVERILKEYSLEGRELPKFLLMENVSNILSEKHIHNFNEWCSFLEELGYINQVYTLDARNFGVPQSRIRTYMISSLATEEEDYANVGKYFFENNLENIALSQESIQPLSNYLRLDYSISKYRDEAIESTPVFTESRKKIYENNQILAIGQLPIDSTFARTITTKQDRHPNSGIIRYDKEILTDTNAYYRNLTPRECFLLMGFKEESFDLLMEHNYMIATDRKILAPSKLIKLAGNSIVVQVLEAIFKQVNELNEFILVDSKKKKSDEALHVTTTC